MVFKKFADRIISAGATAANALRPTEQQHANEIRQLESMGFAPERARHALNATGGDVDRAAELLLLGDVDEVVGDLPPSSRGAPRGGGGMTHVEAHNDEQMRRAMEESLMAEESRRMREAEAASLRRPEVVDLTGGGRSKSVAAKKREGVSPPSARKDPTAAVADVRDRKKAPTARQRDDPGRFGKSGTAAKISLEQTHPSVKIPERLSNKSKEEQILRCADRLKSHVMAVDTLHRALTSVRNSPGEPKYLVIDRANANYAKFVRDKPGAEDMLLAMNYRHDRARDELRLERHLVDDALLYLGITALERIRTSEEYAEGKRSRAFHAEMRRVAGGNGSAMLRIGMTEGETLIRTAFMGKVPKEPLGGGGTRIDVFLGDESERIDGGRVNRRFDGDDTLEDVLNWLGGCYGNELLEKIRGDSRVWCLCDLNNYPILPFDVEKHGGKTLQYLGLFPSGKLGVRLSDDAWRDRRGGEFDISGSARGLGAASHVD
ncbi:hypothetical protein ACHAW5_000245 [Stephanodiscus triporus]|uniref:UBA domain-containing protein n=1 Tax=Stephanodiscus triporus TaxID=2934178 RepID=A0ABD3NB47_9STRA